MHRAVRAAPPGFPRRAGNPRGIVTYLRAISAGGSPAVWEERLEPLARLTETWWLGLRLENGVDPAEARAAAHFQPPGPRRAGAGPGPDPCQVEALRLAAEGLLEEREGRFRLTPRGLPLADWVAKEFLSLT